MRIMTINTILPICNFVLQTSLKIINNTDNVKSTYKDKHAFTYTQIFENTQKA